MPVEACFGDPGDLIRTGSVIDAYQCHQMSVMLADQTVLRRAVAVRRQMVANRCRTCCDVSRWGAPAMLQHTNCAGHPSICISETTRSSSVLSARHTNTMDSSRDRASTGRGERGAFESAMVGMVEGVEISVVRAVCAVSAVSTVPAVSADSSAASGPSTPAGLSRSSTLSPVRRRVEPSANRAYPAVGARSRAYRSGHHTDQPSSTRKHGHGHVHRHALGIGPPRDRSTRVPTRASRSARRNRTRRSPAAYGVQSCSPAT